MAQDNAQLLQDALDATIREYKQHCLDREEGKERVTYTLNGRNFNWTEYRKAITDEIKELSKLVSSFGVAYAETRVG